MKQIPQKVDIPGYEGLYYVTISGKVFAYNDDIPLTLHKGHGYFVCLYNKEHKRKTVSMSWIMRMCYFGGKEGCLQHKAMQSDFAYWNLKLISKHQSDQLGGKTSGKMVVRILDGETTFYSSISECARENFFPPKSITSFCRGERKNKHNKAIFMFEEDYYLKYELHYNGETGNNQSRNKAHEGALRTKSKGSYKACV